MRWLEGYLEEGGGEGEGNKTDKGKGKAVEVEEEIEDGTGIECQCCFAEYSFVRCVDFSSSTSNSLTHFYKFF
jgi:hypothetical protein